MKGVYQIFCKETGLTYTGSSTDIAKRLRDHMEDLMFKRHSNYKLQADFDTFGRKAFTTKIVEIVVGTREKVYQAEQRWIDKTPNSYNILTDAMGHLKKKTKKKRYGR